MKRAARGLSRWVPVASGAEPLGPGRDASRSGPRGFPSDPGLALRPSAGSAPGPALTATPLRCPVDELTLACPPGSLLTSTDCPCRGGKPSLLESERPLFRKSSLHVPPGRKQRLRNAPVVGQLCFYVLCTELVRM